MLRGWRRMASRTTRERSPTTLWRFAPTRAAARACRRGWSNLANDANRPAFRDFDDAVGLDPNDADAFSGRGLARARFARTRARSAMPIGLEISIKKTGEVLTTRRASTPSPRRRRQFGAAQGRPARGPPRDVLPQARFSLVLIAVELAPVEQRAVLQQSIPTDPALQPIRNRLKSLDGIKYERPSRP